MDGGEGGLSLGGEKIEVVFLHAQNIDHEDVP